MYNRQQQAKKSPPNKLMRWGVVIGVLALVLLLGVPCYILGFWHFIVHSLFGQPDISFFQAYWLESFLLVELGIFYIVFREQWGNNE